METYYKNNKKDIELMELIYTRLNYLDLYMNKKLLNNVKNEIKNIIKPYNFF